MSERETLFGIPLPNAFSANGDPLSKSKAKQSEKAASAEAQPEAVPEKWFGRGAIFGLLMSFAMFIIGDYSGLHRREAIDHGIRSVLTEWTDAHPNVSAAEVLAAVKSGQSSPQKSDSTTPPSSKGQPASQPARSTVEPSKK